MPIVSNTRDTLFHASSGAPAPVQSVAMAILTILPLYFRSKSSLIPLFGHIGYVSPGLAGFGANECSHTLLGVGAITHFWGANAITHFWGRMQSHIVGADAITHVGGRM